MEQGENISVVVQGPVHGRPNDPPDLQVTRKALASARGAWPACEIILSTWKDAETTGLDYDILVTNDDPGAVPINDHALRHVYNNLNRQIVTTGNGLNRATRRHAVKLRSDFIIERPLDLSLIDSGERNLDWCLLEKRVITLNLYTRNPLRRPVLFHLSDMFQAGLTSDLRTIWSAPLVEEPAFTRTINPHQRPTVNAFPGFDYFFRCTPEQYLAEQLTRRKFPGLHLLHHSDGTASQLFIWLRMLANNFSVLTTAEAGLGIPARFIGHENHYDLIQPADHAWLNLWIKPHVSALTRLQAAISFKLLQLEFSRKPFVRRSARHLLKPLVRLVGGHYSL